VLRTTVWHDTERLMRTTVAEFPDSYRGHLMLGGYAFEHRRLQEGERELQRAFALFPYDASAPFWLAEQYRKVGMCRQAIAYYRAAQAIDAAVGNEGHARCLVNERQYDEAIAQIRTAMQREGDTDHLRSVLSWAQSEAAADHVKILNTVRTSSAGKPQDSVQKTGASPEFVTGKR
jgi:tetratricopeptide (TPR) repeat protein